MRRAIPAAVLLIALAACTTTTGTTPTGPSPQVRVRDIELAPLRGEVGVPYSATLTWVDNYITEPELRLTGAPPGLTFDSASRTLRGTPKRAGFYTVQVAIRKRVRPEPNHRPTPDERWWPATFEVQIFAPIKP
jgi:hypothetical protein